MLKACKIRLYPNEQQKHTIATQIGGCRYIYNRMLALRINAYKKFCKSFGKYDLIKHATKLKQRGGELIKVNPQHTSQTCPICKCVSKENRLTQSKFVCKKCSYTNNADVVGALNILDRGIHGNNASHQIAS